MVSVDLIKKFREETGVGVMDARRALTESGGDVRKAKIWLSEHAVSRAAKKADRETTEGAIVSYVHQTGKVAAMVKLGCETDFVARTDDFKTLGREIAMQVASMAPGNIDELLAQAWIREPGKTIERLVQEAVAKLGENVKILEITRMDI